MDISFITNRFRELIFENVDNNIIQFINNKKEIKDLFKHARKYTKEQFVEEYIYLSGLDIIRKKHEIIKRINKGDEVDLGFKIEKNGDIEWLFYKKVISNSDYSDIWKFIMDNSKELQKVAEELYEKYSKVPKKKIKNNAKTVIAYHVSPYKFNIFRYTGEKVGGQIGSHVGFFFFLDKKYALNYANVIKQNKGVAFLYEVKVNLGKNLILNGEEIGTSWGRVGELEQAEIEGYDTVIIKNADTGYGFTDELVVFDDDNIEIINVEKIKIMENNFIKNKIREYFFKEEAKRFESISETTGLFIRDSGKIINLSLYDPQKNEAYGGVSVVLNRKIAPYYFVGGIAAIKGFGPFIYELIMMYLNEKGQMVMPSRDGDIRTEAWNVWEKFFKRSDVKKKTFPLLSPYFRTDILLGENYEFENDKEKVEWWKDLDKSEKHTLIVFNTAYSMKPNDDYYKLIEKGENNSQYLQKAIDSWHRLWGNKY